MKRHSKPNAFTLLEVTIVTAVMLVLLGTSLSLISPTASKGKARDNKRLADVSNLDRAVNEYKLDYGYYPGQQNFLYTSISLPAASPNLYNSTSGWIPVDLSDYFSKYPVDPTNDATYYYEYFQSPDGYEISTRLEQLVEQASSDGGNDPAKYEIGSNLLLITP